VNAALAAEAAARADLVVAQQNLDWTKITAPYAGRLSRRQVDPGNLIVATVTGSNGMVSGTTTGTLLTTLVVLDPIYIGFDIDERTLENRREGIRAGKIPTSSEGTLLVDVGLGHETGYTYKARVTFSENQLDSGTGTLHIRAEMDNPSLKDGLPAVVGWAAYVDAERKGLRLLSPGMFVRVRLPMGQPHKALTVPEEAIVTDQGQRFVYVVNDKDEAEYRQIVLGPLTGGLRAIEDGIKAGERVIVSGQQRVRKNGKVKARFATPTDSPTTTTPSK
jgi:multidrug efflux pump subunit AcrA (membrane-fusion protein)